jgi:hypothetical protein
MQSNLRILLIVLVTSFLACFSRARPFLRKVKMNELFAACHGVHALDRQSKPSAKRSLAGLLEIQAATAQSPIKCQTVKIQILTAPTQMTGALLSQ